MSSKSGNGWGPYVFTRSAYDEQRDAEIKFGLWIDVALRTTFQKGVYLLVVSSRPLVDEDYHLKHKVSDQFPSSHAVSFEALLYQNMHKLVRMLENAAADKASADATRHSGGWKA